MSTYEQKVVDLWSKAPAKRLPGLYPWLQFELLSRDDWIETFGINLERIDERATNAYLKEEATFFEAFGEEFATALGKPAVIARRQHKLEWVRARFIHAAANLCQSPIEQLALAGLVWSGDGYAHPPAEIWDPKIHFGKMQSDIAIVPQHYIGDHRVDFAISIRVVAKEEIKIAVECDGREYHQAKEQMDRDTRRNRDLQIAGWNLLRFTGSEIWRDYKKPANDVNKLVINEIERQLQRRGLK
jgi:very-short-patch-repair endonuclease